MQVETTTGSGSGHAQCGGADPRDGASVVAPAAGVDAQVGDRARVDASKAGQGGGRGVDEVEGGSKRRIGQPIQNSEQKGLKRGRYVKHVTDAEVKGKRDRFVAPKGFLRFPSRWTPLYEHTCLKVAARLRDKAHVLVRERKHVGGYTWYYEIYYRLFTKKEAAARTPIQIDPFQSRKVDNKLWDGQLTRIPGGFMANKFAEDDKGYYRGRVQI